MKVRGCNKSTLRLVYVLKSLSNSYTGAVLTTQQTQQVSPVHLSASIWCLVSFVVHTARPGLVNHSQTVSHTLQDLQPHSGLFKQTKAQSALTPGMNGHCQTMQGQSCLVAAQTAKPINVTNSNSYKANQSHKVQLVQSQAWLLALLSQLGGSEPQLVVQYAHPQTHVTMSCSLNA